MKTVYFVDCVMGNTIIKKTFIGSMYVDNSLYFFENEDGTYLASFPIHCTVICTVKSSMNFIMNNEQKL